MTRCGRPASSSAMNGPGCRGGAPTEPPHTRWRRFGPGTGRTAAGGSASGPAIALDERRWFFINTSRIATTAQPLCSKGFRMPFAGTPRVSISRRHSCACAAVSDSHARSWGSSSRPSGVTSRPPLNEKPAQGPVSFRSRTIRLHARVGAEADARTAPASRGRWNIIYIMRNGIRRFGQRWSSFVGSALQWLGLWLGSCLRPGTPAKDEIAA